MARRLVPWQQLLLDALDLYEIVGVRAVVESHLGRRGQRAESIAAQRAARMLARSGRVEQMHVRVPASKGRKSAELLIVGRPGIDFTAMTTEALQQAATRRVAPDDRSKDSLADLVAAVDQAAAHLGDIDLHALDGEEAVRAARSLAKPLVRLTQLRRYLLLRRPGAQ